MKHRQNIFLKTFSRILIALLFLLFLSYLFIYLLLPTFYKDYKEKQLAMQITDLQGQLDTLSDPQEIEQCLADFSLAHQIHTQVYDEDCTGALLYDFSSNKTFTVSSSTATAITAQDITDTAHEETTEKYISTHFSHNIGNETWYVALEKSLQSFDETKSVIIQTYPFSAAFSLLIAFALSAWFSHLFVTPIREIQHVTEQMEELQPDCHISIQSKDEIGELSESINHLYLELKGTIDLLHQEMEQRLEAENQKVDFLRMLSHELKTPLASANALIEGILYDVSPYSDCPEQYLNECHDFLEKAIQLTKESLKLSQNLYEETPHAISLSELFEATVQEYTVFFRSRQIQYEQDIPKTLQIFTKEKILQRALANIISNTANYTRTGGLVRVVCDTSCAGHVTLKIYNTCTPLDSETLKHCFDPFYRGGNQTEHSSGLGLYIVNQFFHILRLPYGFEPSAHPQGMCFWVTLPLCPSDSSPSSLGAQN